MIMFTSILLAALFSCLSYIFKTDCLHIFLTKEAITIMGVMLSINCASVSNLHLKLVEEEKEMKEECYKNTKKEIRQNIVFSIFSFLGAIIAVFIQAVAKNGCINYIIDGIIMAIFLLHIYAVYEITVRFILNIKPQLDE